MKENGMAMPTQVSRRIGHATARVLVPMASRPPPPTVTYTPPEPVQPQYSSPLGDDDGEPRLDATPADDDSKWRFSGMTIPDDPVARDAALLTQCESRLQSAWLAERPQRLLAAIRDGGCNALASTTQECAKCRICPSGEIWEHVGGYYRANRQKLFVCADKQPTQQQVEDVLTHELVHAYDHCRFGVKIPLVGRTQAPWALTCAAEACSAVRAVLMAEHYAPQGRGLDASLVQHGLAGAAPRASTPAEAAAVQRQRIYTRALETTERHGTCAREGRDCKALLDAVFNACLADHAPIPSGAPMRGGTGGGGGSFPPMPAEVEQADRMPPAPPPRVEPPPPPPGLSSPAGPELTLESQELKDV